MTDYRRPGKQIETLKSLGIPARKQPDNRVLVLRVHCMYPVASPDRAAAHKPTEAGTAQEMNRRRKTHRGLPRRVQAKHGAYYFFARRRRATRGRERSKR